MNWFLCILVSKVLIVYLSILATLNWYKFLTATSIFSVAKYGAQYLKRDVLICLSKNSLHKIIKLIEK